MKNDQTAMLVLKDSAGNDVLVSQEALVYSSLLSLGLRFVSKKDKSTPIVR